MTSLVIAEYDSRGISHVTRSVITAASIVGGGVHILVAGGEYTASCAEEASKIAGVSKVISVDSPAYKYYLPENIASLVVDISIDYSHIFAAATTFGKDFMPRVAALLDVAQISDIISVIDADTFTRPIYAGNAIATVKSLDSKKVVTVRPSAFDKANNEGVAEIKSHTAKEDSGLSTFVSNEETKSDRPELTSANIVISGGRGVGSAENFVLIEKVADKLGAAIGASRAAVDSGFVTNDYQVGQTGKIVAPDLYIAVGISGAIQHIAGITESKVIVAINKDENAPIFDVADYGLVADLFDVMPELESKL